MDNSNDNKLVPLAIIVAGLIVAGAIYFGGGRGESVNLTNTQPRANTTSGVIAPVTEKDHVLGSRNAEIMVIEYSDFDCPFCKSFHNTMHQIVDNYGGKVAWVYRQFPIASLHPNATKKSEASECVAEIGGNEAFWKFTNELLGDTDVTLAQIPTIVANMGLDIEAFNSCFNSGKYANQIQADVAAAAKAGAQGTPYSVIITKDGKKVPISGAQPFENVKLQIDALLK